jgi:1,4-dihydroxy-6-naphthoate synthase
MLKLGYSTCPNDTFIFDALVHSKIDHAPGFETTLADVSELNDLSLRGALDITKISFGVIAMASKDYQILDSGSALGFGCGPLLIAKEITPSVDEWIKTATIAIPGAKTTANLLLSMAYPETGKRIPFLFSEIEDAVLNGRVDAGLIIHENRFTFEEKGLKKLIDLGAFWEQKTGLPIPLGCIAVKRSLPEEEKKSIQNKIRESVEYAFKNPDSSLEYVSKLAQTMNPDVMRMHIQLYVNEFSVSLGKRGRAAVTRLLEEGQKTGILPKPVNPLFVDQD